MGWVMIEWDENKRQDVLKRRGIDLLDAALIFENEVITQIDGRWDYGETRFVSLGMVDGECYIVVHTERNGVTRLITAWKGGQDDRTRYQERFARRDQADERSR
jgi:uncharacterized DUF497 family protein